MNKIIYTNKGIALVMVLSTIALMSFVLATFTISSKINKHKIYNQQDRSQAKLNAESGIVFAMAKLRLYKEALNLLEQNEGLKDVVPLNALQSIITQPFIYPIPITKNLDPITKNAINEFSKNMLLNGMISIEIKPITGFLNPNALRLDKKLSKTNNKNTKEDNTADTTLEDEDKKKTPQLYMEEQLVDLITDIIENKKEDDDEFNALYSNLRPDMLVKELKYYILDKNKAADNEFADITPKYSDKNTTPKFAQLSSISELYLLEGWPDDITNLIKDRLSVHEVGIISINDITASQLKVIFPGITKEQSSEFFAYRDGIIEANGEQSDKHPFKTEKDFKDVIVNRLAILTDTEYQKRIKELEAAGLKLGVAGKTFKITSVGQYKDSIFSITAYVDLPIEPPPKDSKKNNAKDNNSDSASASEGDGSKDDNTPKDQQNTPEKNSKEDKKYPTKLLNPRIIEIQIN